MACCLWSAARVLHRDVAALAHATKSRAPIACRNQLAHLLRIGHNSKLLYSKFGQSDPSLLLVHFTCHTVSSLGFSFLAPLSVQHASLPSLRLPLANVRSCQVQVYDPALKLLPNQMSPGVIKNLKESALRKDGRHKLLIRLNLDLIDQELYYHTTQISPSIKPFAVETPLYPRRCL